MKMKIQLIRNLRNTLKAVLRGKFIVMSAYIKNTEGCQIINIILCFKVLEKHEQAEPKTSRRREIIKVRGKMNEMQTKKKKKKQRINKTNYWFFEKLNKID
jgi:hypothetical protein